LSLFSKTKEAAMTDGALMDAAEIAIRLGMAKSSIYALCASGAIPAYKCGKNFVDADSTWRK
jgi:hypothetical protein